MLPKHHCDSPCLSFPRRAARSTCLDGLNAQASSYSYSRRNCLHERRLRHDMHTSTLGSATREARLPPDANPALPSGCTETRSKSGYRCKICSSPRCFQTFRTPGGSARRTLPSNPSLKDVWNLLGPGACVLIGVQDRELCLRSRFVSVRLISVALPTLGLLCAGGWQA